MGGMGKADDETIVGGKWSWSTFAHPSFVIQRYIDVVQIPAKALGRLILNPNLQMINTIKPCQKQQNHFEMYDIEELGGGKAEKGKEDGGKLLSTFALMYIDNCRNI